MSGNLQSFQRAVRVLVGPGAVKQRLIVAYLEHLQGVQAEDLPDEVCVEFAALQSAFCCVKPAGGLCAAEVAVRKMSEQEATAHAERILSMSTMLSRVIHGAPEAVTPPRLRVVGDDDELPAFLSRA
jgi:hypothetical protein